MGSLLSSVFSSLLTATMELFERPMVWAQRRLGQSRIAWLFLAPNLVVFAIMWRWNDFLWPLIILTQSEQFTLQLALNAFQGDLTTRWHHLLAMTVLTLLPITLVFAFLQRYITTGIANTGIK